MLRATARLITLLGLAGCGARSALPGGSSASPSPPPVTIACPAAVEKGSPAPMLGYCSTREYRAPTDAPSSPHVTWTASIGKGDFIPTMAIDAQGRAYVAQESPPDPTVLQIQRVDPPGTVAWSTTFDESQAGTPIVGADGNVRTLHLTNTSQPELIVVDPGGATVATIALPNDSVTVSPYDSLDPAVGKDGSLYLLLSIGPGQSGEVAKVDADGTVAWRSAPYTGSAVGMALGAGDQPVVMVDQITSPETGQVVALDPASGATRWTRTLPGQPTAGPAIRFDGAVVVGMSDEDNGVVWVLSPADGSTVWSASTSATAGIWLGLGADGTVVTIAGQVTGAAQSTVGALDAEGNLLWQRTLDGDLFYSGGLDASGQVILASTTALALDLATGDTRWSLPPPGSGCAWPMTVATGNVLYGMQCDGTFFAAGD